MMHIAQNLFEFIKFTKFSTTTRVVVFQDGHGDSFGSFLKQKKNNYWFICISPEEYSVFMWKLG